jgi:hypothetical protein
MGVGALRILAEIGQLIRSRTFRFRSRRSLSLLVGSFKSSDKMLIKSALIFGALLQAIGSGLAIILGFGFLASCAALVASCLGGFGERSIAGTKVSLVLAIICGLAYLIVQAAFAAGGVPQNIQVGQLN